MVWLLVRIGCWEIAIGCGAAAYDSLGCKPEVIVFDNNQAAEQRRYAAAPQLWTLGSLENLWLKPQAIRTPLLRSEVIRVSENGHIRLVVEE